jgi:hypothetical protein
MIFAGGSHVLLNVLQPSCNPSNPYYNEYKYFMRKVAEKTEKIKFLLKILFYCHLR